MQCIEKSSPKEPKRGELQLIHIKHLIKWNCTLLALSAFVAAGLALGWVFTLNINQMALGRYTVQHLLTGFFPLPLMHLLVLNNVASLRKPLKTNLALVGFFARMLPHMVEKVPSFPICFSAVSIFTYQNCIGSHRLGVIDQLMLVLVPTEAGDALILLLSAVDCFTSFFSQMWVCILRNIFYIKNIYSAGFMGSRLDDKKLVNIPSLALKLTTFRASHNNCLQKGQGALRFCKLLIVNEKSIPIKMEENVRKDSYGHTPSHTDWRRRFGTLNVTIFS